MPDITQACVGVTVHSSDTSSISELVMDWQNGQSLDLVYLSAWSAPEEKITRTIKMDEAATKVL